MPGFLGGDRLGSVRLCHGDRAMLSGVLTSDALLLRTGTAIEPHRWGRSLFAFTQHYDVNGPPG